MIKTTVIIAYAAALIVLLALSFNGWNSGHMGVALLLIGCAVVYAGFLLRAWSTGQLPLRVASFDRSDSPGAFYVFFMLHVLFFTIGLVFGGAMLCQAGSALWGSN